MSLFLFPPLLLLYVRLVPIPPPSSFLQYLLPSPPPPSPFSLSSLCDAYMSLSIILISYELLDSGILGPSSISTLLSLPSFAPMDLTYVHSSLIPLVSCTRCLPATSLYRWLLLYAVFLVSFLSLSLRLRPGLCVYTHVHTYQPTPLCFALHSRFPLHRTHIYILRIDDLFTTTVCLPLSSSISLDTRMTATTICSLARLLLLLLLLSSSYYYRQTCDHLLVRGSVFIEFLALDFCRWIFVFV